MDDKILVSRAEYRELQQMCASLKQALAQSPSKKGQATQARQSSSYQRTTTDLNREVDAAPNENAFNDGRVLQDPDGTVRYLGESSGATFLDHLREFMATVFPVAFNSVWPSAQNPETAFITSLGSYQTHDSRPMLVENIDSFVLPSKTEASIMISDLRYFVGDGSGDFPSGGIYYWGDMDQLLREHPGISNLDPGFESIGKRALHNAAFALACQVNPACTPKGESSFGENFFARAKLLVGNPLDIATINDVPVFALLGAYLLEMNRRDAAYIYISTATRILIVHGVHRGWMVDEKGKRIFWTVYILDR